MLGDLTRLVLHDCEAETDLAIFLFLSLTGELYRSSAEPCIRVQQLR